MGVLGNSTIMDSAQLHATFMYVKKTEATVKLVRRWLELGEEAEHHFIDDSASRLPNAPGMRPTLHPRARLTCQLRRPRLLAAWCRLPGK